MFLKNSTRGVRQKQHPGPSREVVLLVPEILINMVAIIKDVYFLLVFDILLHQDFASKFNFWNSQSLGDKHVFYFKTLEHLSFSSEVP